MLNIVEIIEKKRDNKKLTKEEIKFFIDGYTAGDIEDYQMSALLMAIYINGMTIEETVAMTEAMKLSGDIIDLSEIKGVKVDKHSTGGVGDKTTLIVAPIVAACDVPVAKMSGRGLGFTGGTIDKLHSIKGFQISVPRSQFMNQVNKFGLSVIGQTAKIAPADKKIYALRDVTGTVGNISLIAGSIMSKKLASGGDAIVLDVKCGKGAFMKSMEDAEHLSNVMVDLGKASGKNTIAVITDMNQPLGDAVGNSLEVIEAIEILKGRGNKVLKEFCLDLSAMMIYAGGKASSLSQGKGMAEEVLENGKALEKFKILIREQGGEEKVVDDYTLFKKHKLEKNIIAKQEGFIEEINAEIVGISSQRLGAGRKTKEDDIDVSAGVYLYKHVGDFVQKGDKLATVYADEEHKLAEGYEYIVKAWHIVSDKVAQKPIIKKIIIDNREVTSVSEF